MVRTKYVLMVLPLVMLMACGRATPDSGAAVRGFVRGQHVLLWGNQELAGDIRIRIDRSSGKRLLTTLRSPMSDSAIELFSLPDDWKTITAVPEESDFSRTSLGRFLKRFPVFEAEPAFPVRVGRNDRLQPPTLSEETREGLAWWIWALFIWAGLWSTCFTGATHKPHFSEPHPVSINIVHLAVFVYFARDWANGSFYPYLGFLVAALLLAAGARILMPRKPPLKGRMAVWAAMLLLYGGMGWILAHKNYQPYARWADNAAIQFFVPKPMRHRLQLLTKGNTVVDELRLDPNLGSRMLYFAETGPRPSKIRIIPPEGSGKPMDIPIAPPPPASPGG